jgi:pyrroloquinoline-quinone synthase
VKEDAVRAGPGPPCLSAGEFLTRLEIVAQRHYQHRHPFKALMIAGRLDRGDLRLWLANAYYYETRIAIGDALILAKAEEDPTFRDVWRRRLDRHGPREPRESVNGVLTSITLEGWAPLGAALDLSPEQLESGSELLPGVRAACDEQLDALRAADLLTAVAFSLTEYFAARLIPRSIEAWSRHYSFVPESALRSFERRVPRADDPADVALDYVQTHARTGSEQRRCLGAFERKCKSLSRLLDSVYLARRLERVPRVEHRASLMRLRALASAGERQQVAAPGVLIAPERALALNRTAYDLLERCDGQLTLEQVVLQLSHYHRVVRGTVERDVAGFVAELERRRILAFEGGADRNGEDRHTTRSEKP